MLARRCDIGRDTRHRNPALTGRLFAGGLDPARDRVVLPDGSGQQGANHGFHQPYNTSDIMTSHNAAGTWPARVNKPWPVSVAARNA